MKKILFSLALLAGAADAALAATTTATTTSVAIAPLTFAGRIVDYTHAAYDGDASVEIRLKSADGTLLAKTTTATSGSTIYNYVLYVPVATEQASRYACVGDKVTFEFVDPKGDVYTGLVASADAVIGNPGAVKRLDVVLATDEDGDGIADEYLEDVEYLMWKAGKEGPYDPKDDSDGDGVSNYNEYLAGTNPYDATDRFTIQQMAIESGKDGYVAIRIPVKEGRAYSILHASSLAGAVWEKALFTEDADAAPSKTFITTGATETGYRTIFVKKSDDAQHFYKVQVE